MGGTAHLQSQGEGEAANPHRPVPQGFEPWTSGSEAQYSTPESPAPDHDVTTIATRQPHLNFIKANYVGTMDM